MKRGIIFLVLILLMSSMISAEIIFTQPVAKVYNLGDSIYVPITIKTLTDVSGTFKMDLICNSTETNFYQNGVMLASGEERSFDATLVLIRSIIGQNSGTCKIKAILGADYVLSDDFKISNWLSISGGVDKTLVGAGEVIAISGKITKETGQNSNGLVDVKIDTGDVNQVIVQTGTINDGLFSANLSLPANIKAGDYVINLHAYEQDSDGLVTNDGTASYNISVLQVPTNLELIIPNKQLNPGESLQAKAILHDQTGDPMNGTAFVTIKDSTGKIMDQEELNLTDTFQYSTKSNEPPAQWTILMTSGELTAQDSFIIKTKESLDVQIVNKTILITNNGNIFYNKTILVRVGDSPLNLQVSLDVGESKKYVLSAPNGDYSVKVSTGDNQEVTQTMSLTGNAVGIQDASTLNLTNFIWGLIIIVLAVIIFFLIKRIYKAKKPFVGRTMFNFNSNKPKREKEVKMLVSDEGLKMVPKTGTKAELSLSIKGEQQDASVVCLKIKNLREMGRGSPADTLSLITDLVEESKGTTYENQDYLFYIFAPMKTKTMRNEKLALDTAERIQGLLMEHNRKFNQKIEFGISLNVGTIVAKIEEGKFKFMTMGSLMGITKKVASLSNGEILLSDKINDLLRLHTKAEKEIRDGTPVYVLKEIKRENEEARKFINKFMERQKRDQ